MNADDLIALCQKYEKIYIYGAGKNAKEIYEFLAARKIMPHGFLVSEKFDNPDELYGIPVIISRNFDVEGNYLVLTSALGRTNIYKDVLDCLVENGIHNVLFLTTPIISEIREKNREYRIAKKLDEMMAGSQYCIVKDAPVEYYHRVFAMKDDDTYHWRIFDFSYEKEEVVPFDSFFTNKTALEEFEEQYGTYHRLKCLHKEGMQKDKTYKVYMARCHVDREVNVLDLPEWLEPIQVGAALTDKRICKLTDDVGDHISDRNGIYSECSAIYWMWKNAPKTDYIGLCHYRRHFDIPENDLSVLESEGVDVLVTTPTFEHVGIEQFLWSLVPKSDFITFQNAIEKIQPEYSKTAEEFLKSRFYPPCNLFIMKYEWFQKYAEFVFSITFEVERFYKERGFIRNDRYMGYLVECLLGIFLMQHKDEWKIAYTDMKFYK